MSKKRYKFGIIKGSRQAHIIDCHTCKFATIDVYDDNIKYFVDKLNELAEENEQLKIANAKWLDKSLQEKQIRYSNANHKELVKKYLQLQEENASLEQRIRDIKYNNSDEQLKNKLNKHI